MATVETIEIATAIRAALAAVVPNSEPVYARGVPHDIDGNPEQNATECQRKTPCVDILMRERTPGGYRSVMHEFAAIIRVVTHAGDDPFQERLYTIADAVAGWLVSPPSLSLTLRKLDAITTTETPQINSADGIQYMEWNIGIHTGPAIS